MTNISVHVPLLVDQHQVTLTQWEKNPQKNTDAQKYGEILIEYGDSK